MITIPFDAGFIYFILFAPVIGFGLSFIIQIIIGFSNSSKNTKTYRSYPSTTKSQMRNSSPYHIPYDIPIEDYETKRILSSMESEMRNHNARMEQMMLEQEKNRLTQEMYKLTHETGGSLADKVDTRLTNIFRNPWEGIL